MRWIVVLLVVFFFGLQYRLWVGEGSWAHIVSLEKKISDQKDINERLVQRNKVLEIEILGLKNGKESVEERARLDLGLVKKGETFYLLVDKNKQ
jgi:cell division protein FtsB